LIGLLSKQFILTSAQCKSSELILLSFGYQLTTHIKTELHIKPMKSQCNASH